MCYFLRWHWCVGPITWIGSECYWIGSVGYYTSRCTTETIAKIREASPWPCTHCYRTISTSRHTSGRGLDLPNLKTRLVIKLRLKLIMLLFHNNETSVYRRTGGSVCCVAARSTAHVSRVYFRCCKSGEVNVSGYHSRMSGELGTYKWGTRP